MKRVYQIIAMALIVAVLPLLALARHAATKGKCAPGPVNCCKMEKGEWGTCRIGMLLKWKDKLELTDEQVQKLEAVKTEVAEPFKAAYEAIKAKKLALKETVKSNASAEVIRAAANELGTVIGDKAVLKAETKAKVDVILTDAQKTKLQEIKQQRKECHKMYKDPEAVFKKIDINGDGSVSPDEFKAHTERMKACKAGKEPMPVEPDKK